jgi:ribonuclease T2
MKLLLFLMLLLPLCARSQQPGKFDFYLLSLSWSPEYCYNHRTSSECEKHLGLVVHGLWPQYSGAGRGPEYCGQQPGLSNPETLLDIMPSVGLIQHEWETHGTCSGLSPNEYFALIRRIFAGFHAPYELQQPRRQTIVQAAQLKHDIELANRGLTDSELALTCTGPYLKEVEICLTKEGKPRPCSGIRECPAPSLRIPPIR